MAHRSQEQSLREELTCAICFDLFRDPVMLDCMHHFCQECIQSYWDSCSDVATCPQCRREFPKRSFRPQYLVSGVVEKVRRCTSGEHRRKVQQQLEEALQSFHMEHEKMMKMKLGAEEKICSLLKTSGELNSKIRAAFEHLHHILDEEERTVLMELAREEGQWLMRLEGDSAQLAERMSCLKKNMEHIQQQIDNLENSLFLEVESVAVRPATDVEALTTFNIEQHKDLYDGPLQYIFWRRMLKSVSPGEMPLIVRGIKEKDKKFVTSALFLMQSLPTAPAPIVFDPETAHPNLILSKDLTAVTERETPQHVPRSPKRFLQSVNVLGKASFKSGRHYWEVWVGNKTKWDLGVAAHSVDRTARVRLCPENGYWAIRLRKDTEYWAAATPWVHLRPKHSLRKVGILLDCSTKKVAFYNAEDMSFLFAFHQAQAHKFYPFFSTCFSDGKKNHEPMRICHLNL